MFWKCQGKVKSKSKFSLFNVLKNNSKKSHKYRNYAKEMENNKIFKNSLKDTKKIYGIIIEYDESNLNVENSKVFINVWVSVFLKTGSESWKEQKYSI